MLTPPSPSSTRQRKRMRGLRQNTQPKRKASHAKSWSTRKRQTAERELAVAAAADATDSNPDEPALIPRTTRFDSRSLPTHIRVDREADTDSDFVLSSHKKNKRPQKPRVRTTSTSSRCDPTEQWFVSHDDLIDMQIECNLSQRQVLSVMQHHRRALQRSGAPLVNLYEPSFKAASAALNQRLLAYSRVVRWPRSPQKHDIIEQRSQRQLATLTQQQLKDYLRRLEATSQTHYALSLPPTLRRC